MAVPLAPETGVDILASFLAPPVHDWLLAVDPDMRASIEEVRIRAGRPAVLYRGRDSWCLSPRGLVSPATGAPSISQSWIADQVEQLAARSLYAHEHELAEGYLTLPGGHRVGLAGRAVLHNERVRTTRDWTGLNLRVARSVAGAADGLLAALGDLSRGLPPGVLVLGPPRAGKTTLLRDAIPKLSRLGWRVVVVDERHELVPEVAAAGLHTDVLNGWPKPEGLFTAVRVLGPDVAVVDEIGSQADGEAVRLARRTGVSVWASAHGGGLSDARCHPVLGPLLLDGVFTHVAMLAGDGSHRLAAVEGR